MIPGRLTCVIIDVPLGICRNATKQSGTASARSTVRTVHMHTRRACIGHPSSICGLCVPLRYRCSRHSVYLVWGLSTLADIDGGDSQETSTAVVSFYIHLQSVLTDCLRPVSRGAAFQAASQTRTVPTAHRR
ncbi:hypothetical protein PYCCODRAFT_660054 [Trametes coccinea BRFM310]|uniref:Uncharacterized protein n=1 Tax=Trametes coccinea (strain BRFM310) TaxID=1353009 RepID=A0A1Y2IHU8_TRAC3|nr:hypothetical protein PYCCODRAFT_660054 [Trametes coccinea BRFM310]